MKDLIVAGFPSAHAALLAQSAIARQFTQLKLTPKDIAVISRESESENRIVEAVSLGKTAPQKDSFWKKLAEILFSPNDDVQNTNIREKLCSVGIDADALHKISTLVPQGATAILAMVPEESQTVIASILSNCQGTVASFHTGCDCPSDCLETLFLSPNETKSL